MQRKWNSNETETVEEKQDKKKKTPTHCEGIAVMVDKYEAGVQLNLWGEGGGGAVVPGRCFHLMTLNCDNKRTRSLFRSFLLLTRVLTAADCWNSGALREVTDGIRFRCDE